MAYLTKTIDPSKSPLKQSILDKHYLRKHGKDAYYGQE
jgi:L-ribulose-5-phosphate 4-epimerase